METLPAVLSLGIAWHIGLTLYERHRRSDSDRPPMANLLLSAEVELLRTLHGELKRRLRSRRESRCESKLEEVDARLEELGVCEEGLDVR